LSHKAEILQMLILTLSGSLLDSGWLLPNVSLAHLKTLQHPALAHRLKLYCRGKRDLAVCPYAL